MGNNSMFAAACATDGKTAGWLPESYGFLRIHKVNIYYAMAEYQVVWPNAELWRGYYNAGDDGLKWSGWQPIATATPPQVFDLPLSDGWTEYRASEYFKTQENIVTVYFQVHTSSPQGGEIILARLPEGFRPQNTIGGSGYCGISGEKKAPADMKVYPNGDITGFNDVGAAEYYTGFFTFVAAS